MSKMVRAAFAAVFVGGLAFTPWVAAAATDVDKAALQQATASCKVDTKEYAKYHETSWWQGHKMVQKCVKDALAKK